VVISLKSDSERAGYKKELENPKTKPKFLFLFRLRTQFVLFRTNMPMIHPYREDESQSCWKLKLIGEQSSEKTKRQLADFANDPS
jgi:hypothetical protein